MLEGGGETANTNIAFVGGSEIKKEQKIIW